MEPEIKKTLDSLLDALNSIQKQQDALSKSIEKLHDSGRTFIATDIQHSNRIDRVEKHLNTDLPQHLELYKKKTLTLEESTIGIVVCQKLLFQLLTRDGVIKREEVGLILDSVIAGLVAKQPNNPNVSNYLKQIRDNINKSAPFQYPDWLQEMIGGNDPKDPNKV